MHHLGELNRLLTLLRDHKETISDPKVQGLLGNIIGEIKSVIQSEKTDRHVLSAEAREIIDEYKNDPVIQTYLKTKEEWQEKVRDLESEISLMTLYDDDHRF